MNIRNLGPDDATAYQHLRLRGLAEEPASFASSYEEESPRTRADWESRLQAGLDGAVLGAFEQDELLGIVGVQREAMRKLMHKAWIWGLYVRPESRRRGSGRALLAAAIRYARSMPDLLQLNLGVDACNLAAQQLYRAFGFQAWGHERGFMRIDGELRDEITMALVIAASQGGAS